ncbi:hypothetical protein K2173_010984 [Erythroxylum novogranatense]|uniref:KIB1-4 beta-propeller domain-containing protein n=1 Tax=Erythroxylum novogranatense TaxID=1862640 RepID=A0AAV8T1H9_9ROSI|nr:hypothetical protein K2173_010984 [Erythroxylum novogranatense]
MPIQLRLPTCLASEGARTFLLVDVILCFLILPLSSTINVNFWLLTFLKPLDVFFLCLLTGSKRYLIHFHFTLGLLNVWLTYQILIESFNGLGLHLHQGGRVGSLMTCLGQWVSLGSHVLDQYKDCNFVNTGDLQRPTNRRRISVAGVDGEPVSGDKGPIIQSDKAFVLSRKLINDIAQTEDWSGLLNHCLTEIVKKLQAFHDFTVFSTVCIPWRLACLNLKWSLYPPHPWSIHFQDQNILNHLDDGRYYYGCVNGWILNIGSANIHIFNLFSRTQTNLPILSPVGYLSITKPDDWYSYIQKFILFKACHDDNLEFLVVALFGARGFIAFTGPQFQDWICIQSDDMARCRDVVLFEEQFYALCGRGKLFRCVFDRSNPIVSLVSQEPVGSLRADRYYLVKNVDHLITVFQYGHVDSGGKRFGTVSFRIYRSDNIMNWTHIREPIYLKSRALFISNGNSWTIDPAEVESCRTNSIYFVDDYWFSNKRDGHFTGLFDIAQEMVEDFQFDMDQYPPKNSSPFSLTYRCGG